VEGEWERVDEVTEGGWRCQWTVGEGEGGQGGEGGRGWARLGEVNVGEGGQGGLRGEGGG
jgi:hypothetical protein